MPLLKGQRRGNNGNHGKKGVSGRKSYFVEKANVEWLAEAFFKEHTEKELRALAVKKSISNKMLEDALKGNKEFILALFKKLFPDISKQEVNVKDLTDELNNQ